MDIKKCIEDLRDFWNSKIHADAGYKFEITDIGKDTLMVHGNPYNPASPIYCFNYDGDCVLFTGIGEVNPNDEKLIDALGNFNDVVEEDFKLQVLEFSKGVYTLCFRNNLPLEENNSVDLLVCDSLSIWEEIFDINSLVYQELIKLCGLEYTNNLAINYIGE